jgi:Rod binding domain-containing protein
VDAVTNPQSAIRNPQAKAPQTKGPQSEKLRKATREMESFFVGTLLKKMHETAAKGGLFEDKSESATYRDMFDDAVANEIGKRGAFGIADTLYKELVVHLDGQSASNSAAGTAAGTAAAANGASGASGASAKESNGGNDGGKDKQ